MLLGGFLGVTVREHPWFQNTDPPMRNALRLITFRQDDSLPFPRSPEKTPTSLTAFHNAGNIASKPKTMGAAKA